MADPNNANPAPPSKSSPPRGPQPGGPAHGADVPPSARPAPKGAAKGGKVAIQAPKGTRDLYPEDAALRRYITEAWRNTSIRHGFEEIDGPTFEDADLYRVKSGEGILGEMFGVYSGKSEEDRTRVQGDPENPPYALRPEFTPTLARMYAARAAQLGKPTKWFTAGPFFRAERPQRGRLREFLQWNVDFIGLPAIPGASDDNAKGAKGAEKSREVAQDSVLSSGAARANNPQSSDALAEARARADAECIACCIDLLASLGLSSRDVRVRINDRSVMSRMLVEVGIGEHQHGAVFAHFDRCKKVPYPEFLAGCLALGVPEEFAAALGGGTMSSTPQMGDAREQFLALSAKGRSGVEFMQGALNALPVSVQLLLLDYGDWVVADPSIVRGLAYYTGMVFEVIADGERAVAGGGRYDNLIELFGGPPTPAVGFGMGDVVLTNLLRDKGLLPQGATLLDRLSAVPASARPDVFVLTADEALDPIVRRLVADLRRGSTSSAGPSAGDAPRGGVAVALHSHAESPSTADQEHACSGPQACHTRPLHARHTYKSTRNVGKLLKDAAAMHARFAVIIENPRDATIKDMAGGRQHWCPIDSVPRWLAGALSVASS